MGRFWFKWVIQYHKKTSGRQGKKTIIHNGIKFS